MNQQKRNALIVLVFLILAGIALVISVVHNMSQPKIGKEEPVTELQTESDAPDVSQKETQAGVKYRSEYDIPWGDAIPNFVMVSENVFNEGYTSKSDDEKNVNWKNSYAKASLKVIEAGMGEPNCEISYTSELGSISGLKLCMVLEYGFHASHTYFKEIDMNNDGYKELVIEYMNYHERELGSGDGLYVYDFREGKELKYFNGNTDGYCTFTENQRKAILDSYKKWFNDGFIDLPKVNGGTFNDLRLGCFHPMVCDYNNQVAVVVWFGSVKFSGFTHTSWYEKYPCAILIYTDGEYVVDKVWYDPEMELW
ncbi:MAG: hypothetical protein IJB96_07270 [Lachnospira sp.]|nr:hypothetical protein [Lachnospira sp.]